MSYRSCHLAKAVMMWAALSATVGCFGGRNVPPPHPQDMKGAYSMTIEQLRQQYGGTIDAHSRSRYNESMYAMAALFNEWDPVGSSRTDVKALMGEPTFESDSEVGYVFRSGRAVTGRRFWLKENVVVSVEGYDGVNSWPLPSTNKSKPQDR